MTIKIVKDAFLPNIPHIVLRNIYGIRCECDYAKHVQYTDLLHVSGDWFRLFVTLGEKSMESALIQWDRSSAVCNVFTSVETQKGSPNSFFKAN